MVQVATSCFLTVWGRVMWGNKGWMGYVELRLSTKCQAMMIFRPPLATRSRDIQRIQILAATKYLVMLTLVSKYLQSASILTIWHCCYLLFECCHVQAVFLLTSCKKKSGFLFWPQQKSINKISFKDERENLFGGGRFLHVFGVVSFQLTIANFTHGMYCSTTTYSRVKIHSMPPPKFCRFVQGLHKQTHGSSTSVVD